MCYSRPVLPRLALALMLLAATGPAAGEAPVLSRFLPVTDVEGAPAMEGTTWVASGTGWTVWLRPVDDVERQNFIERTTGVRIDPFAAGAGREPRYLSWLLVIRNESDQPFQFNPGLCWMRPNKDVELQRPLDYEKLSFDYRVAGGELPPAYQTARAAVFERAVRVSPGETVSGLLIYRQLSEKVKRFSIEVPFTLSTGYGTGFTVSYRAITKKDRKAER